MAPILVRILTQQQQMSTMRRACNTPAVPTIQVSRKKRITPKIFCRQGRYTPIRVPILGAYGAEREGGAQNIKGSQLHQARPAPDHSEVPLFPGCSIRDQVGEENPECKCWGARVGG